MIKFAKNIWKIEDEAYSKHVKIPRFIISGGTATVANLGILFIFTHFLHVWYLLSAIVAFLLSFFVSFSLQKFWTFRDRSKVDIHKQAGLFFVIVLLGLTINTTVIYGLVEYFNIHYLIAQFISGIFIAFLNYYLYQKFIFKIKIGQPIIIGTKTPNVKKIVIEALLVFVAVGIFVSLAFTKITENPPTWMDEGIIIQAGMNVAQSGVYGFQTTPGHFVSAGFLTTDYPVVLLLALFFKIGGVGLFQARLLMIFFLCVLLIVSYFFIKKETNRDYFALFSLFLLVTFAPLYGHGKNVIGEVPGLVFFLVSLFILCLLEKGWKKQILFMVSGFFVGLSMVTKPIFLILLIPSIFLTLFIFKRTIFSLKEKIIFLSGSSIPVLVWFVIHVSNNSLKMVLFSGNPDSSPLFSLISSNLHRFLSESQPIYFGGLLVIWGLAFYIRRKRTHVVSFAESLSFVFSCLSLLAYLTTRGFYRYFFPAEVLALIFLPSSIFYLSSFKENIFVRYKKYLYIVPILFLIIIQIYNTLFNSWLSGHVESRRAELLSKHLGELPLQASILFYNVPETIVFLPHQNYFQYFWFAESVQEGNENKDLLLKSVPDYVIVDDKFLHRLKIPNSYDEKSRFDKYILFEKRIK